MLYDKAHVVLLLTFCIPIRHNGDMAFADWFGVMPKVKVVTKDKRMNRTQVPLNHRILGEP